MKNLIILLTLTLLMTASTGLSQTTNLELSNKLDIVKTIMQNDIMRAEIIELRAQLKAKDSLIEKKDSATASLLFRIEDYKGRMFIQQGKIFDLNRQSKLEEIILTDKLKSKKFGIGVSLGMAIVEELKLKPYLGIGITFNFISF